MTIVRQGWHTGVKMLNNCDYSQFLKRILSHWVNYVKIFSKNTVKGVTIVTFFIETQKYIVVTIVTLFFEAQKYIVLTIVTHIFEFLKMDRIFPQCWILSLKLIEDEGWEKSKKGKRNSKRKKKIQKFQIDDWKSKKSCFSNSSSVPQNCRIELQSPSIEAPGVCG